MNTGTTGWIINGQRVEVYASDPSAFPETLVSFEDCEAQGGSSTGNGTPNATCTFDAIDGDKTLNVTFTWAASKVTVNAASSGQGDVSIPAYPSENLAVYYSYPGMNTGTTGWIINGQRVEVYASDPFLTATLVSFDDCEAQGGTSAGNGTPNATCTFDAIDGDKTLNVTFTLDMFNLNINKTGGGTGSASRPST